MNNNAPKQFLDFMQKTVLVNNNHNFIWHAIGAGGLGSGQIYTVSPTTRHRCDVSSELCCPGAKPRRWAPQLVTRFGVIRRV